MDPRGWHWAGNFGLAGVTPSLIGWAGLGRKIAWYEEKETVESFMALGRGKQDPIPPWEGKLN